MIEMIWIIDENHRVYRDDDGNKISYPNIRHYFVERRVIRETRQNFIVDDHGRERRIAKDAAFTSQDQIEDYLFVQCNRHLIADRVRMCNDAPALRQIAALLDTA